MDKVVKKTTQRDRIPLSAENAKKIDQHLEQIKKANSGVKISKKIYVNHLISKLSDELTQNEIKAFAQEFFDQESFLKYLMNQVKESKKSGSDFDLNQYLSHDRSARSSKRKKPVRPKGSIAKNVGAESLPDLAVGISNHELKTDGFEREKPDQLSSTPLKK